MVPFPLCTHSSASFQFVTAPPRLGLSPSGGLPRGAPPARRGADARYRRRLLREMPAVQTRAFCRSASDRCSLVECPRAVAGECIALAIQTRDDPAAARQCVGAEPSGVRCAGEHASAGRRRFCDEAAAIGREPVAVANEALHDTASAIGTFAAQESDIAAAGLACGTSECRAWPDVESFRLSDVRS